jgi:hypothetical protein
VSIAARALLVLAVAVWLMPAPARADDGRALGSPWPAAPVADAVPVDDGERAESSAPGPSSGPSFDLSATTMVPLTVGGAMHFEIWEGIFLRVQGAVIVPAYVDGINDVGRGYGIWDEATASTLSEILVDSLVIESTVGIRPLGGPLELSVGHVLIWSEGPGPSSMSMQTQTLSISVHAVHAELGIRMPLGDALVMRIAAGWLHGVGQDVRISSSPGATAEEEAIRTGAESTMRDWIARYGMGPTLSASLGIHFE